MEPPKDLKNTDLDEFKAFERLMQILALRDHSVLELREKLLRKGFSPSAVESAIAQADEYNYLRDPNELSALYTEQLDRRFKSHQEITAKLLSKGLPLSTKSDEKEVHKCVELLKKRSNLIEIDSVQKNKLMASLARKGFSYDHIKRAFDEIK